MAISLLGFLSLPVAAGAQSNGLYLSGAIGSAWPLDSEFSGPGFSAEAGYDPGLFGSLALGSTFGENWRGEVALSHRVSDVESVSGAANGGGEISGSAVMVNGYYDLFSGGDWRPYVGAGVGLMRLDAEGIGPIGGSNIDDEDAVVAIQGIAGIGYRLGENLGLFTDYRFLATTESDFARSAGAQADGEYSEHRIVVGLRWSFGGSQRVSKAATFMEPKSSAQKRLDMPWSPPERPRSAPAAEANLAPASKPTPAKQIARAEEPAKPPEVRRRFMVHFDWDRWSLTDEARSVVRAAGEAGAGGKATAIHATGHADRSGPAAYNVTLSQRRAEAVKAELMKIGVPGDAVMIRWEGETAPLTQTADGVREAKNRRVEIILQ